MSFCSFIFSFCRLAILSVSSLWFVADSVCSSGSLNALADSVKAVLLANTLTSANELFSANALVSVSALVSASALVPASALVSASALVH